MNKRLSVHTIDAMVDREKIDIPVYPRGKCGIVHLGVGAFHKAHQALYTDDVLIKNGGDWAIVGVSLRNPDTRNQLKPQGYLYTLVEKDWNTNHQQMQQRCRIVKSIDSVLVAPESPQAVIDILANDAIHIVTMTITEKGYGFDYAKQSLAVDHADIAHDIQHPQSPMTMAGFIVAACRLRKARGQQGFTVISCDNLSNNGRIAQKVVLQLAKACGDIDVVEWMTRHVTFCNSMVDRIVPAISADDRQKISADLGIDDHASVICEPWRQWVIEDNFKGPRPAWEIAGALIVNDIAPYESMKLRLLNGSHSALAYIGYLLGYEFIHQAIADDRLETLVMALMDNEVMPTLDIPTGFDINGYKKSIRSRFANKSVPYRCLQVASDGSQKLPQRLLCVAEKRIQQGQQCPVICLIVAAWVRFLEMGESDQGDYRIVDPKAERLMAASNPDLGEPQQVMAVMAASGIFSGVLVSDEGFSRAVAESLQTIHQHGMTQAIMQVS